MSSPNPIAISPPGLFSKKLSASNINTPITSFVLSEDGSIDLYRDDGKIQLHTTVDQFSYKQRKFPLSNTIDVTIEGDTSYFIIDNTAQTGYGFGLESYSHLLQSTDDFFNSVTQMKGHVHPTTPSAKQVKASATDNESQLGQKPQLPEPDAHINALLSARSTIAARLLLIFGVIVTIVGIWLISEAGIGFLQSLIALFGVACIIRSGMLFSRNN